VVRLACSGSFGDLQFINDNWLGRWLLPDLLTTVSRVVALDQATRDEALRFGVREGRLTIISNGLLLKRVRKPAVTPDCCVFIGRLAEQKRVSILLEAFARLRATLASCPRLVIAGDGEQRGVLAEMAHRLSLDDGTCTFVGHVDGPEETLDNAICAVNPSVSEGLPNAVLEALAFGVPPILSDIPVHREIAAAVGAAEYLFPVDDSAALTRSLQRFLVSGDRERADISRRCIEYSKQFTRDSRDQTYLEMYRDILKT